MAVSDTMGDTDRIVHSLILPSEGRKIGLKHQRAQQLSRLCWSCASTRVSTKAKAKRDLLLGVYKASCTADSDTRLGKPRCLVSSDAISNFGIQLVGSISVSQSPFGPDVVQQL